MLTEKLQKQSVRCRTRISKIYSQLSKYNGKRKELEKECLANDGHEFPDGAKVCIYCGFYQNIEPEQKNSTPKIEVKTLSNVTLLRR